MTGKHQDRSEYDSECRRELARCRQTAAALHAEEQRYRGLFEGMPDGWLLAESLLDEQGGPCDFLCLEVNSAFEQLIGLAQADVVGKRARQLLPDLEPFWNAACREVAESGRAARLSADVGLLGRHFDVAAFCPQPGRFVAVFRDVTTQRRTLEALRAANAYNRSLLEASLDPLVVIGPTGRITDANAAAEAVTGHSRQALLGSDFADYFTEPERARSAYRLVFRQGTIRDYALELRHRDGRTLPVLYSASVYRDEAGRAVGVFAAARDISARKRAEEELHRLNQTLEQRVAERTAQLEAAVHELEGISYSVSHDLRIPVRAVDGFAGILLAEYRGLLDAEGQRLLGVIRDNAQRMERFIDGILDFLRLGRSPLRPSRLDMELLVREVYAELDSEREGRSIRLAVQPLPPATGDRAMLRQVLLNLLGNAIKFTRPKAQAVIEIGAQTGERENTYWVRDNGVGFDMRYATKLFGISHRLHGVEEFEGTGVGLATVHRIISRHHGRVWAEGRVGEGAVFYFTLPLG